MVACVDLFCGVGGLSYGLSLAGIEVKAGVDLDESCRWSYERNVGARFIHADVDALDPGTLSRLFEGREPRLLAGCAPCQPFSTYGRTRRRKDDRWRLLGAFSKAVRAIRPEFVTMENVPGLERHEVFREFVRTLRDEGYSVEWSVLECERYGVPQRRRRLVLVASRVGEARLPEPTHAEPVHVIHAIGHLPAVEAGAPPRQDADPLHVAAGLSPMNRERIRHSRPGGTWRDWPERLVAECHRKEKGKTYPSVYGRMRWDEPAPTITTQCYGFGNGRFGHPEQDRAITLREAAILQSFPEWWRFVPPGGKVEFGPIGRMIGNAVPPRLGEVVGRVIVELAEGRTLPAAGARAPLDPASRIPIS